MSIDEIKQLLMLAYKLKASKIRYKDLYVAFSPQKEDFPQPFGKSIPESLQEDVQPTEDELLYWSTDFKPDIKAEAPE